MQRNKHFTRSECGSATVEAIVAFTGFLLVVFTILNVVNYCRAQMLISNALDTAAKELSQYAYFYKMSGLQKFDKAVKDNADVGADNLNNVIGTVDKLYQGISKVKDDSIQAQTNVKNAVEGNADVVNVVKNTLVTLDTDITNVDTSINSVMSAIGGVGNDPILYMKSIIAVAGNESLDLLKSHVIAAPLAKLFFIKHFGGSYNEASEKLEQLGVKDGLEGMNFKMSTVFSSNEPDNIHLVVYYRLELSQFFKGLELEIPICKESVTRAWLGGDDVLVKVKPVVETKPLEEEKGESNQEEPKETDEQNEQQMIVDTEGSFWYLSEKDEFYYNQKESAFDKLIRQQANVDPTTVVEHYYGRNDDNIAYSMAFCKDANDAKHVSTFVAEGLDAVLANEKLYTETAGEKGYEPDSTKMYCMVVYIPENISEETLQGIKSEVNIMLDLYIQSFEADSGKTIPVQVDYRKAGGNYDYSSGGGDT